MGNADHSGDAGSYSKQGTVSIGFAKIAEYVEPAGNRLLRLIPGKHSTLNTRERHVEFNVPVCG